jgi:uncharacterized protein YdiU (UPF0061 family)
MAFGGLFEAAYIRELRNKLGLREQREGDFDLAHELLDRMTQNEADFTLTFRRLADAVTDPAADVTVAELFADGAAFMDWATRWRERLAAEGGDSMQRRGLMRAVNPAFIPRNHLVEEVIAAAVRHDEFAPFEALVAVLAHPFDDQPGHERYRLPPRPEEVVRQTFCGT